MTPTYDFGGQVALVTGAGSGMGPATARAFADGGAEAMTQFMRDQPIGRPGSADAVAAAAVWLCSPGASFVLGVALPVDGGFVAH